MDMIFQKEFLTPDLIESMMPLLLAHNKEVEFVEESPVNPDWPAFQYLQKREMFHLYTAREGGVLVGYVGYIVANNLHFIGKKYALCDLIYVLPEYRGRMLASRLLKFAEIDLIEFGVSNIGQSVKLHHEFGAILKRNGYHLEENYYSKGIH